jgi:hypothetical protein
MMKKETKSSKATWSPPRRWRPRPPLSRRIAISVVATTAALLVVAATVVPTVQAQAEFTDHVDPTYHCPATITCQRVCVVSADDCPNPTMQCANGTTLCVDGTCAAVCEAGLESPCAYDCAKTACPRHVDLQTSCEELFGDLYAAEAACGEAETVAETSYVTFTEPAYLFAYGWVSCITLLTMIWCCYNQRLAPVHGSTKPLYVEAAANNMDAMINGTGAACQHSGYKNHLIGLFLNYITLLTFAGWNALLCYLSIQYYAMDGNEYVSKRKVSIEDEEQLLKTYIVTWCMGFLWCLCMLKWPHSVRSVFLRRCPLSQSSFVAVYLELPKAVAGAMHQQDLMYRNSGGGAGCTGCMAIVKKVLNIIFCILNGIMSVFVFSDKDCFHQKDGVFKYCPVQTDEKGTRYFIFLFRRYNYDDTTDSFVPGVFTVGDSLGDYIAAGKTGLTSEDVLTRTSIVGRNSIETTKPEFLKVCVVCMRAFLSGARSSGFSFSLVLVSLTTLCSIVMTMST